MEFRILGPLDVLAEGQALDLGGQKQRALLAVLLLEANRVVSADRLIDALWEDERPETAGKALQVYVSRSCASYSARSACRRRLRATCSGWRRESSIWSASAAFTRRAVTTRRSRSGGG